MNQKLGDLQFAPEPLNGSVSFSSSGSVLALRQDLATMQKQLALVLEGQAELQATLNENPVNVRPAQGGPVPAVLGKAPANGFTSPPSNGFISPEAQKNIQIRTDDLDLKVSAEVSAKPQLESRGSILSPVKGSFGRSTTKSFGESLQKDKLRRLFLLAEEEEAAEKLAAKSKTIRERVNYYLEPENQELLIDSIMAAMIFANAVFVGVSMDHSDGSFGWLLVDFLFSLLFIVELLLKVRLHGVRGHFFADGRLLNIGDVTLVIIDWVQLVIDMASLGGSFLANTPSASLFRVVRLLKIARVLRLFKTDFFKDLLDMIQGVTGGLSTLMWSMIFFLLVVYVTGLAFREMLGRSEVENVSEYFDSIPRSMLSTFRCSFGDCSTAGGVPIFEFVFKDFGTVHSIIYCLFVFSLTIGLFNVISAIFVESTMSSAQQMSLEKKTARLRDERLLSTRVTRIIKCILKHGQVHGLSSGNLSEAVDLLVDCEVDRAAVDNAIKEPDAIQALDDLDINPQDRARLSDIFDPDNGGTVQLSDVASGIRRLRGDPRRSDIVCVDLMIRSLQGQMKDVFHILQESNAPTVG